MQMGIFLKPAQHGMFRHATQGYIAMFLPVIRVERQITQQVNRRLEHKQPAARPNVAEAIGWVGSVRIPFVAATVAVQAPFVGMLRDSVLVFPHKYRVVNLQFRLSKKLPALIQSPLMRKMSNDRRIDVPLLDEVGKYPTHIAVGRRQMKRRRQSIFHWIPPDKKKKRGFPRL